MPTRKEIDDLSTRIQDASGTLSDLESDVEDLGTTPVNEVDEALHGKHLAYYGNRDGILDRMGDLERDLDKLSEEVEDLKADDDEKEEKPDDQKGS